jgi:hypothetical protein
MCAMKYLNPVRFFMVFVAVAGAALSAAPSVAQSAGSCGQAYPGAIGDGTLCRVRVSPEVCRTLNQGRFNSEQGMCYFGNQQRSANSGATPSAPSLPSVPAIPGSGSNRALDFLGRVLQIAPPAIDLYNSFSNRGQNDAPQQHPYEQQQAQERQQAHERQQAQQRQAELERQQRAEEDRRRQEQLSNEADRQARMALADPFAGAGTASPNAGPSGSAIQSGNPFGNRRAVSAAGNACVVRLRQQRLVMLQNAEQCGVSAEFMQSLQNEKPVQVDCNSGPVVLDQRGAQLACARVYACAANALTVAMAQAQAGMECTAAQQVGLARWPVPTAMMQAVPRAAAEAPLQPLHSREAPAQATQSGVSVGRPGGFGQTGGTQSAR